MLLAIEGVDRGGSVVIGGHFDKAEAFAAAGFAVAEDLRADDASVLSEQLLKI